MVQESRIVAWSGVGLGVVLTIAVAALVLAMIAVQDDVGVDPAGRAADRASNTVALRDDSVTADEARPRRRRRARPSRTARSGAPSSRVARSPARRSHRIRSPAPTSGSDRWARSPRPRTPTRLGGVAAHRYLSQVFDVSAPSVTDQPPIKGPVVARCPAGSRVISGGATIAGAARGAAFVSNAPAGATGWTATARVARRTRPRGGWSSRRSAPSVASRRCDSVRT